MTKGDLIQMFWAVLAVGAATAASASDVESARPAIGALEFAIAQDEARIAYYDSGPKGARAVVLLASLGRSVSDFNELAIALNDAGFRTVAVEMRGVGRSAPIPKAEPTLYDLGDDVEAAINHVGVSSAERVDIIGHAFGNRLARAFAAARPDRVNRIALIAAGGAQDLAKAPEALQALKNSFDGDLPEAERHAAIRFAFFANDNLAPDFWLNGWHGEAARFQSRAVRRTPEDKWRAAGGEAPILIIQGAEDRIAPAGIASDLLKSEFPERVQVVTVDDAGHALLPEQPTAIAGALIAFLKEID